MMWSRKNLFLFIALFYTLYIIFPLFADIVNIPVWLPSILSSALMIVLFPKAFCNKTIYWSSAYAVVLAFFVLIGKPLTIGIGTVADNKKIFIEFAYILPAISIFSIFLYLKDFQLTKKYVTWSTLILYVSFIVAVPLMIRYNSLREALSEQSETLVIPGLPGYSLMHAYPLFLIPICYMMRVVKGIKQLLAICALFALCFVIYSTYVTTSYVIMLAILTMTLTYKDNRSPIYWLLIFFVIYILYEMGVFLSLLDAISPYFNGTAVARKIDDIRSSMTKGEITGATITGRQRLHEISWDSFFSNPFWGTSVVGGHSSLLDRFGGMGVLGGVPFMMIFVSFYKEFKKILYKKDNRYFFMLGVIAGLIYLYVKGNWGAASWLMLTVMMPMALWVFNKKQ